MRISLLLKLRCHSLDKFKDKRCFVYLTIALIFLCINLLLKTTVNHTHDKINHSETD